MSADIPATASRGGPPEPDGIATARRALGALPRSRFNVRPVSHADAAEVAQRLINSHFRNGDGARISIPCRPDHDDDCLILAYIEQQGSRT